MSRNPSSATLGLPSVHPRSTSWALLPSSQMRCSRSGWGLVRKSSPGPSLPRTFLSWAEALFLRKWCMPWDRHGTPPASSVQPARSPSGTASSTWKMGSPTVRKVGLLCCGKYPHPCLRERGRHRELLPGYIHMETSGGSKWQNHANITQRKFIELSLLSIWLQQGGLFFLHIQILLPFLHQICGSQGGILWETFHMILIWRPQSLVWKGFVPWTSSWILFQAPPQAGFATLSELLNFSEPHFPHLWNGRTKHLPQLWWGLNQRKCVKHYSSCF